MFNWFKDKFKKKDKEIVEASKDVEEKLEDLSDNFAEDMENLSENISEKADDIKVKTQELSEKITDVKEDVAEKNEEFIDKADDAFDKNVNDVKDNISAAEEKTDEKTEKIEAKVNEEKKLIKEEVKEVSEKIKEDKPEQKGMFKKLFDGLNKTRKNLVYQMNSVFQANEINDDFYDELEEILVMSDIGAMTTMTIIDELKDRIIDKNIHNAADAKDLLKEVMLDTLNENIESNDLKLLPTPSIVMLVGVNGVGKTTTVGKLAYQFKQEGMSVAIIAADTFRAAAIEQLEVWGERADVKVISQAEGADPASVVFDGLDYSIKNNVDITIIDTAGRLHNKVNLMNELNKIRRIIDKKMPGATLEVIMALDATTGQNALLQLKEFKEVSEVTGVALTKLDGTAKGGVIIPIQHEIGIPVKIIGVGESIYDLQPFDPKLFVDAIFEEN